MLSTLAIAAVVWVAGYATAQQFGSFVDTASSLALIGFGGWIAISAWRDLRNEGHGHSHDHHYAVSGDPTTIHAPELQNIATDKGAIELSIFEESMPPHFRVTGTKCEKLILETVRPDGVRQSFAFVDKGGYWQSTDSIPEPHGFDVIVPLTNDGKERRAVFAEHEHHGHSHAHVHKAGSRTALLLILGSSPMVEGIPAFFAAGKYGVGLILVMSIVFGLTTIATYVILCVYSVASLKRVSLGPFERYGEVLSGAFIALVGLAFWVWPVL